MKLKRIFRDVLLLAVAAPASFSVLAKLDKKWNFGEYLNRLVLNFEAASNKIWGIISINLPFLQSFDHLFLSFFVLTVTGTFASVVIGLIFPLFIEGETQEDESAVLWGYSSVASLLIISFALEISTTIALFAFMTAATPLTLWFLSLGLWRSRKDISTLFLAPGRWIRKTVATVFFFFLFWIVVWEARASYEALKSADFVGVSLSIPTALSYYALTMLILIAVWVVWRRKLKGPTMVLLFSVGVLAVDFLDREVRPSIESFLNEVEQDGA